MLEERKSAWELENVLNWAPRNELVGVPRNVFGRYHTGEVQRVGRAVKGVENV